MYVDSEAAHAAFTRGVSEFEPAGGADPTPVARGVTDAFFWRRRGLANGLASPAYPRVGDFLVRQSAPGTPPPVIEVVARMRAGADVRISAPGSIAEMAIVASGISEIPNAKS